MPSTHIVDNVDLPTPPTPRGAAWIAQRLGDVGYSAPMVYPAAGSSDQSQVTVAEDNVSKNQLLFDMTPNEALGCSESEVDLAPGTSTFLEISGPPGTVVNVTFTGIGFVQETQFSIDIDGIYMFQLGPCPIGLAQTDPQLYFFSSPGTSISPVGVTARFM